MTQGSQFGQYEEILPKVEVVHPVEKQTAMEGVDVLPWNFDAH